MIPITNSGYALFMEGQIALAEVEANGMKIDTQYLYRKIEETDGKIKSLSEGLKNDKDCRKVYKVWKQKYAAKTNLGSREQLGTILFDVLKIEGATETQRGGRWRTDKEALDDIDLPFVSKFLQIEKLKKANTTYLKGILREVDENGFLHPSFNLNLVATFRSSCSDPNLQNIPIRDEEIAKIIRPCFIPRAKNRQICEADFSGIEVRGAAIYTHDPVLVKYIRDPKSDMHRDFACDSFLLKKKQVSKKIRYVAKNRGVFPFFYGSWHFDCARNMWIAIERMKLTTEDGIPLKKHLRSKGIKRLGDLDPGIDPSPGTFIHHMKGVEYTFWKERFRVYDKWKYDWYNKYLERGFFDTLTGFRCTAFMDRKQCCNYPIQGSCFNFLLWCLIRIQKILRSYKMKSQIICQVHDSIVSDCPEKEMSDYLEIAHQVMTKDLPKHYKFINVPIEAEMEVAPPGKSWLEKAKYE